MSASLLTGAGPIPGGGAFYIPFEETSDGAETLSEIGEAPKDREKLEIDTPPPGGDFEIAIDLNSAQPSYIGDDARLAQLRDVHMLFRKWKQGSSGSGARISEETLCLLPEISRAVIQLVQELQKQKEGLEKAQKTLLAEKKQMRARISSLQKDNEMLRDAKRKYEDEIHVLKRNILQLEELYASTKAPEVGLEEQLNENRPRAASDRGTEGSSNKRRRDE